MSHNDVGDALLISHEVRNLDGDLVNADTVTLTVTLPDGTTTSPAVTNPPEHKGYYEVAYTLTQEGRHTFEWLTTNPDTASADFLIAVEPGAPPSLAVVKEYLGADSGHTDAEIQGALAAELAAQARVCRTGPPYSADLAEALKRRVARNLALRAMPIAVLQGDAEGGSTVLPGSDPEVRRFEKPYRKVRVG